jgi:exonuclease VII small subunit
MGKIGLRVAVICGLAACWGFAQVSEQPPSQLLEKGIYSEETVGDLDEAISLYLQAIDSAKANRVILAQAQLRLGLCYLKQGEDDKASTTLQTIIDDFVDQEEIVAEARKHLPDAPEPLQLGPAPWPDGEVLRFDLKLASGVFMGMVFTTAEKVTENGRNMWRLGRRRFIASRVQNQGISTVDADAETFAPITSTFKHTILGDSEAEFSKSRIRIASKIDGKDRVRTVEPRQLVFDDEQAWHLMRRMPLAVGYKTRMMVIPVYTGAPSQVSVEVDSIESVSVAAGTFDCFKVNLPSHQATFWYSTDANRTLVKFEAEGIIGELGKISDRKRDDAYAVKDPDYGFALSVPAGWYYGRQVGTARDPQQATIILIDPDTRLRLGTVEIQSAKDDWTLDGVASSELQGAKKRFKDYTMRAGSFKHHSAGGVPAISFVGDYKEGDDAYVQYRAYLLDNKKVEFIFKVAAEHFDEMQPAIENIVSSYRVE